MFSVLENPWYDETIKYKITKEKGGKQSWN